jgi:preprotein translocase subunit Sss1
MPMDLSRIKELLERYWDCSTTVEEEEELRTFFKANNIPDEFKESAKLFRYFEIQRTATLDDKFEAEIIAKIKDQKQTVTRSFKPNWKNYLQVAAVLAGLVIASIIFRLELWEGDKPKTLLVEDTFKTPEEAYEETKKAFLLIAEKMNSGRVQAQKIGALNEAEEKIKK